MEIQMDRLAIDPPKIGSKITGKSGLLEAFDNALLSRNVKEAVSILGQTPFEDIVEHLKDHKIRNLPTWHHLARFRFKSEVDQACLTQLLQYYVKCGYDLNQKSDGYRAQKRASGGFTALLAAIEQANVILVEALISHGANVNIRDKSGFSPCHWAILVGDLRSLRKLIEAGAVIASTKEEIAGEGVHPILHTAVDEGRAEIVYYLAQGGFVDINEEATYRGILTEGSLTSFPSRYNCLGEAEQQLETVDVKCTPLSRAVRMRKISIIEVLLKWNAKLSGLSELHFCIVEGDTEVACLLKKYYPKDDLRNDKIKDQWALHCLHPDAFSRAETLELIQEYLIAGWNINEISPQVTALVKRMIRFIPSEQPLIILRNCTLLHVACLHGGTEVIQFLVESGADINLPVDVVGGGHLYPVQLSMLVGDLETVKYFMERGADFTKIGHFEERCFSWIQRAEKTHQQFSSTELLLGLDWTGYEPIVSEMLDGINFGLNELYVAVEGGNPALITKVLKAIGPKTSKKDFQYVAVSSCLNLLTMEWIVDEVPLLSLFFKPISPLGAGTRRELSSVAEMLETFGKLGYDFSVESSAISDVITNVIRLDFENSSNMLLTTLLRHDSVLINPPWNKGEFCIKPLLTQWDLDCSGNGVCWQRKNQPHYCKDIKILISHGLDVSKLKITKRFRYHYGYNELMKLLYCAGAQIMPDFFQSDNICHPCYASTQLFRKELKELESWTKEQDRKRKTSLKFLCRVKIRRMIKNVGDLNELLDPLKVPRNLIDQVLCREVIVY